MNSRSVIYNVAGAVVGAALAAVAIFGLVSSQSSIEQPQTHTEVISYNG